MRTTYRATTRRVGVREAKTNLSKLLADVRLGREWVITERGEPIAKLVPISSEGLPLDERVRRLEASGLIESRSSPPLPLPPPLPLERGLAQRLLQEDRDR